MRESSDQRQVLTKFCSAFVLVAWLTAAAAGQAPAPLSPLRVAAPLAGEEVVKRMEQRNLERASALRAFEATRTYRLEYRGFPTNRDAEMVASVVYQAPESQEFTIASQ